MPLIQDGKKPTRYNPIRSLTYNPAARGFDLRYTKGHYALGAWLGIHSKPVMAYCDHWHCFIPEIYWFSLFRIAKMAGHVIDQDTREFFRFKKPPPWPQISHILPATIGGTQLRAYQFSAVRELLQGNLILGDDMGLGKTVSTIHAWLHTGPKGQLIVVVPNDDVASDWFRCNTEHFANTNSLLLLQDRKELSHVYRADIILIPYSKVWRTGYKDALLEIAHTSTVVFDEGHRISRVNSQQHKGCYDLAVRAQAVWVLSGTEVSNTPDQYFGMYRMVTQAGEPAPGIAGLTEKEWVGFYRDTGEQNQWNKKNLETLRIMRQGFAIRRTKEEVQKDLPPLSIVTLPCTMDPITRQIYRDLERDAQAELMRQGNPEVLKEEHFWTIYLRLIQLCSHPMLLGEERVPVPNKWERLESILDEAGGVQKIGIWSNFPRTIDWLASRVRDCYPWLRVEAAHGGVSKADRAAIKEDVQAGLVDVTLANPAIWAEGVNLQAITNICYWDYHPSLVRWRQSKSRSHRMGQQHPVSIWNLAYRNSVDMNLLDWLEEKAALSRLITGG